MERITVTFNKKDHTYMDEGGNMLPSTTTIIKELGLSGDYASVPNIKWYAARGTIAHRIAEELVSGVDPEFVAIMLDDIIAETNEEEGEAVTREQVEGFMQSLFKYFAEGGIGGESEVIFGIRGLFAGTADLVAENEIIDWKTSKKAEIHHFLQLGFYCLALGKSAAKIALVSGDGSGVTLVSMPPDTIKKCQELLDLWADTGKTLEQKKEEAQKIVHASVELQSKAMANIVALRAKKAALDEQLKPLEKEIAEAEEVIKKTLDRKQGRYEDAETVITYTPLEGRETKDIDGFLGFIGKDHPELVRIFKTEYVTKGKPSYRVDYKKKEKPAEAPFDAHSIAYAVCWDLGWIKQWEKQGMVADRIDDFVSVMGSILLKSRGEANLKRQKKLVITEDEKARFFKECNGLPVKIGDETFIGAPAIMTMANENEILRPIIKSEIPYHAERVARVALSLGAEIGGGVFRVDPKLAEAITTRVAVLDLSPMSPENESLLRMACNVMMQDPSTKRCVPKGKSFEEFLPIIYRHSEALPDGRRRLDDSRWIAAWEEIKGGTKPAKEKKLPPVLPPAEREKVFAAEKNPLKDPAKEIEDILTKRGMGESIDIFIGKLESELSKSTRYFSEQEAEYAIMYAQSVTKGELLA